MRNFSYEVGDTIVYAPFGGGNRTVVVTFADEDIKNGRAGFDGQGADGQSYWGYDEQIVRVIRK